ncbi:hypothetical protein [Streptomyces sulphureus]|uniref:hypothetical protein n=1 Tax=Streptomyces sulphureus TaxID=47758 RepID=UPI00038020D7|nr:hypothetical protein [Streptomyces sulphureus]
MNSLLGTLGPFGLASVLTVVLIVGTSGGGKIKSLSWGSALILSVLAGASYAATGWPFSLVKGVVNDLLALADGVFPGLTLSAIGLCMLAIIAWKKLSLRGVVMMGIPFFYIAASADGGLGVLANKIALVSQQLAA